MRVSVPSTRYSSVCNVLLQWSISLIPTYRVYQFYDIILCLHVSSISLAFIAYPYYHSVLSLTCLPCLFHQIPYFPKSTLPYHPHFSSKYFVTNLPCLPCPFSHSPFPYISPVSLLSCSPCCSISAVFLISPSPLFPPDSLSPFSLLSPSCSLSPLSLSAIYVSPCDVPCLLFPPSLFYHF